MTNNRLIEILRRLAANHVRVSFRHTFTFPGGIKVSVDESEKEASEELIDGIIDNLLEAGFPIEFLEAALKPEVADTPLLKHLVTEFHNDDSKVTPELAKKMISDFTGSSFERVLVDGVPMRKLKPYIREMASKYMAENEVPKKTADAVIKKLMADATAGVINSKAPFSLIGVKSVKLSSSAKRGKWLFHDNEKSRDALNKWIVWRTKQLLKEHEWTKNTKQVDVMTAMASICKKLGVNIAEVMVIDGEGKVDFPATIINMATEAEGG